MKQTRPLGQPNSLREIEKPESNGQAEHSDSATKLHLTFDSANMLPLACTFASANQNEQKHSLNLLDKTKLILKQSEAKLRSVIADSQYSDGKLRDAV